MLAIDIGAGTQDLLFEEGEPTENSTKLVLPSPTVTRAREVRSTEGDLFVTGTTMGGGPVSRALVQRSRTSRVTITPEASRTVRDDPAEVEAAGLKISEERPRGASEIALTDVEPRSMERAMSTLGVDMPQRVAVAVQDHGVAPPGTSDREYRMDHLREEMGQSGVALDRFAFEVETEEFTRLSAVIRTLRDYGADPLVMDTKLASVAGAAPEELPALVVDAGNGHTLAALVDGERRVASVMEHHTDRLEPGKAEAFIAKMLEGSLEHEEIFDDGGHGACTAHTPEPVSFVKTGPRRGLLDGSRYPFRDAHPIGDIMMTGTYGLFTVAGET
ncbi:MAG: hypothetical protein MAG715_00913 [Methanonatronarchaeales archaeon]|nr:hypothetical protein [Methanonatronarchaeales archaeon]